MIAHASRTDQGGHNYNLLIDLEQRGADENGLLCEGEYGLSK